MLADHMAEHVVACLSHVEAIVRIYVLAPLPYPLPDVHWLIDGGAGLNAELAKARAILNDTPLLVVHADLPFLEIGDVEALVSAAAPSGVSLAPDRHGSGTNALALADCRTFSFSFGSHSFAHHSKQRTDIAIVRRRGLSFDLDTPQDLAALEKAGMMPRF